MKIRSGFISNSSSSSFVVSAENEEDFKIRLGLELDLRDFGTIVKTDEEARKACEEHYLTEWAFTKDVLRTIHLELEAGNVVVVGSFETSNYVEIDGQEFSQTFIGEVVQEKLYAPFFGRIG